MRVSSPGCDGAGSAPPALRGPAQRASPAAPRAARARGAWQDARMVQGPSTQRRRGTSAPAAGPPPTEAALHQAALAHLARFAASEAGLRRVLERRVDRWARRAEVEGGRD